MESAEIEVDAEMLDNSVTPRGTAELTHSKSILAPLIRNAWYVVARAADVGRALHAVKVLGTPLVLYRTEAGEAVALDDRCAHREMKRAEI